MEKMCHLDILITYYRKYECILCCKYVLIFCHERLQVKIAVENSWDTRSVFCVCKNARFHFSFSPTGKTILSYVQTIIHRNLPSDCSYSKQYFEIILFSALKYKVTDLCLVICMAKKDT